MRVAESEQSIGQVFNIGTGCGVTIGELAGMIFKLFPEDKLVTADQERFRPTISEVMMLICNSSKARTVLGWEPQYTLEQGLRRTLEYIRSYPTRYKPGIFNR
jgi:dTDP-glucose 4,6-dehydratase